MASPQAFDKMTAGLKVVQKLSGDVSTAAAVPVDADGAANWFDMRDIESVLVVVNLAVLGGNGIEAFSIVADADSDGGDGNVTIVSHADPTGADAAGDWVVLECSAEQIVQEGEDNSKDLRYIAAKLECHHASDNCLVTLIAKPKRARRALTADYSA